MKKLLIIALSIAATGFSACSQDEPTRHVYHHYRHDNGPYVGTPTGESAETFRANTKPDSY